MDIFYYSYYVTAAPQCPFPDAALGAVLDAAEFDAVYVQFCKFMPSTMAPFNAFNLFHR